MLILTRKVGQGIVIGDDIHLKVKRIGRNRVKIGIEVPSEVGTRFLTRKVDRTIVIRDDIHLKVFKISGNRATIGIEAPPEVKVLRQELLERQDGKEKK